MRVAGKGLYQSAIPVSFRFNGHRYEGQAGDTLASALLANGIHFVARSFKYHRPRGFLSAGSEEPNALVTLTGYSADEPNTRATVQELYEGLEARSQNCWPSLDWDLMSVNDLGAPFLGAGFYYKTFMWPPKLWEKFYEPMIRHAAGLGALSDTPDTDLNERAYAFCDILVIGSGPAGLMAGLTAGRAGADVILAEEDARMGGRLLSEMEAIDGIPAADWVAQALGELQAMDNVRLMPRTAIVGAYDQGTYGAVERVGRHHAPRAGTPLECFWRIAAKRTVLAAGALERPVAFRNNDRPGIMTAGAVRSYLNRWGVAAGQRIAVFGNNDDAHRTARDYVEAGLHVAGVIDSRPDAPDSDLFEVIKGAQVCDSAGRKQLESITIRTASGEDKLHTDCLAMSGGWNPSVHLTCHQNGRPTWDAARAAFLPTPGTVAGLESAGSCNGAMSTQACLREGAEVAARALAEIGVKAAKPDLPVADDAAYNIAPLWAVEGTGRAWLDFQNDVTVKDVKQAAVENFRSVEHMKRYTTQGMATDQGKNSNVAALAILADATGRSIPETGTTTFRPPYNPVAIATLGAGASGKGFAPERLTTSHAATQERNAPMIEAGLWYRPSYFPKAGETTWRQSCDREVTMVREAIGICDVSTLGKIDIQGRDAAKLLDFAYTNMFSTLKEGRVRYGLMLREDGMVMDDGTTARLGANHYVMTTTTAAAGQVMRHLEFLSQVIHPEWDVQFTSVTEQWAQFAVAGPKSRDLLNALLDTPIDNEAWPFMSCGETTLMGIGARLFRISFSGEQGYEIAVPARYGDSLFRELVSRAEALGGGAYGMEALNVLRIEKGFITHSEIHGRVTPFDIGMQGMLSKKKRFFGQTMTERPGLLEKDRERLIGLYPVGAVKEISAGAHLFTPGDSVERVTDQGYVTSVGFSPTLGHMIGLAFLKRGPERIGEEVRLVDHLRGIDTICKVVDPVFFDKDGGRLRG